MSISTRTSSTTRRTTRGFSLVELMVALALGLLLSIAMAYVYLSSKTAFSRQQQLSSIQQSVRIAFEYLSTDARMVGHMGCYTGKVTAAPDFTNLLAAGIATNYAYGIEGYEYGTAPYGLTSNTPTDATTATGWSVNAATNTNAVNTVPVAALGGSLTPGSDVLVIRTAAGRPVRLAAVANTGANQTTFTIENASGGTCSNGTTAKVSGLCANSHALIASCSRARVFEVASVTNATPATVTLKAGTTLGNDPQYATDATEVFPMQTIAYYVKQASSGSGTSLYRRVFDGDNAAGLEQELIEGVENMQVRYGVDTSAPDADGVVDAYVNAKGATGTATDSVTDWNKVVAVRVGLLVRSATPVEVDTAVPTSGVVNGVTITYPTTGSKYDRRVFTTTIAVRNKIAYF
jgi:type IV pilus assembly protein PilW